MAFFPPNVLMSAVIVVARGASSGAVVAAMCAVIVPLLLGCVAGQRALAMDVEVRSRCVAASGSCGIALRPVRTSRPLATS